MKAKTTTTTYSKTLARSGPEMRPNQILLAENDQSLTTQSDLNHKLYNGGGADGGGTIDPDQLNDLATKEALQNEATLRDTGDKANLGLIEANKKDIAAIKPYDDSGIQGELSSLQEGFDEALLAAQEGAENIEIEFQSTAKKAETYTKTQCDATFAKKEDIPEGADLSAYAKKTDIPTDNKTLTNGAGYITLAQVPPAPEPPSPEPDSRLPYRLGTDKAARTGDASIELVDAEDNYSNVKFHGQGGITCTSTIEGINVDGTGLATNESVDQKIAALPSPTYIDWNSLPNLTV